MRTLITVMMFVLPKKVVVATFAHIQKNADIKFLKHVFFYFWPEMKPFFLFASLPQPCKPPVSRFVYNTQS